MQHFPLKGGGFSTRSVISQTQAANQWAYYQAKSIKGYLYEIQKESLELEFKKTEVRGTKALTDEYEKKIALYSQKIKKYDEEKAEISKEAKKMESIEMMPKSTLEFLASQSSSCKSPSCFHQLPLC